MSFDSITDEEIVAELIHRSTVNPLSFFKQLAMQKAFAECKAKIKFLLGGNRSGKTEEGAEYVINKCLAEPNQHWWCEADREEDSIAIQQSKIWALIPKNKIKYGHYSIVSGFRNGKLIFTNGSMITFKFYRQGEDAHQGDNVNGIWNDEEPPYKIYKEQRMRLLDRDGEMIFTMTSLKGMTELLTHFLDGYETLKSEYAPLVDKVLPRIAVNKDVYFFFLWTTENPHIEQHRVAADSKIMSSKEIISRFYGMPSNLSGRIFSTFNKQVHVIPADWLPEDAKWQLWNILDPHDGKPYCLQWWLVHYTGVVFCVDEYPNRPFHDIIVDDYSYRQYAKVIKDKEKILRDMYGVGVRKRIIDRYFGNKTIRKTLEDEGHGKTSVVKELGKFGLKYKDSPDMSIESGHMAVRHYLDWEANAKGEILKQPQMFILEGCINTIEFMTKYSRDDPETPSGDVKHSARILEKWKDFCDTVRYFVTSNPRYIEHKVTVTDDRRIY